MKKLFVYLKPYLKECIIGPFFKLLEAVLELTIPTLTALIIDNGIGKGDYSYAIKTGLFMVAIVATGLISAIICQYSASVAAQGFGMRLRTAMFRKISGLSYRQIDSFGAGTLSNRITNDVNQIQIGVNMFIRLAIRVPFICIGSAVCALILNPALGMIIVASLPIFALIMWFIMKKSIPLYKRVQKNLDLMSSAVAENLSGVRVVRAFSRTDYEQSRFEQNNYDLVQSVVKVNRISAMTGPLTSFVMNGAVIAILWFGAYRFTNVGDITAGELFAFVNYITQMLAALVVLANLVNIFTKANASIGRVNEVMDLESDIEDGKRTEGEDTDSKITFEGVSFGYNETAVFSNLNFDVKKGETLGIIGPTGSGKSTVANLICRFYDADSGQIKIDGVDVKEYKLSALREKIGFAAQKDNIFSGTVKENIAFGFSATDAQIKQAAEIAQADGFIMQKGGYDQKTERGGTDFSGGQRQRLIIARAVCKNPEILILDDSTSALDYLTEANLRREIKEKLNCTTVIISQRVSAVKHADKILVLDDAKAVGFGTHEELVENCEEYRQIVLSQENGGEQ